MGSKPSLISASRSSAVLGINPYQSQFEVWQRLMEEIEPGFNDRMGFVLPPEPDNASIRWGNAFEDAVIGLVGADISDREKSYKKSYCYASEYGEYSEGIENNNFFDITCHIDGMYTDGKLHEGKTTSYFAWKDKWGEPGTDVIPAEYYTQVQHQMIDSGAEECIVSVLVFPKRVEEFEKDGWSVITDGEGVFMLNNSKEKATDPEDWATMLSDMGYFHQYPVKANAKFQKLLLDRYRKWWQDYVIAKKPPLNGASYEDIRRACPRPHGTIVCGPEAVQLFEKYKKAGELEKSGKTDREAIKIEIIKFMRHKESVMDDSSTGKWLFLDECGEKLGQFGGGRFTINKGN